MDAQRLYASESELKGLICCPQCSSIGITGASHARARHAVCLGDAQRMPASSGSVDMECCIAGCFTHKVFRQKGVGIERLLPAGMRLPLAMHSGNRRDSQAKVLNETAESTMWAVPNFPESKLLSYMDLQLACRLHWSRINRHHIW